MDDRRKIKFIASSIGLAAVMLITFLLLYLNREPTAPGTERTQMEPGNVAVTSNSGDTPATSPDPALTSDASPKLTDQPAQDTANSQTDASNAWQTTDALTDSALALPEGVVVYAAVIIDMEKPYYPQPGEQLTLPLPDDLSVRANVKSSHPNSNGDYSWRGYLDGHGTDYPIVMTYGQNSVFATVTTPQGSYTLESINGQGWIYKNPSAHELTAPGATDYLEIPHSHD